ncbi:MAG: hypothetical protein R3F60_17495 [bacterium]
MPVRTADLPVAFSFGRHEADANAPGLEALDWLSPAARPRPTRALNRALNRAPRGPPRRAAPLDARGGPPRSGRAAPGARRAAAASPGDDGGRRAPGQQGSLARRRRRPGRRHRRRGGLVAAALSPAAARLLPPAAADAARAAPASADAEAGSDAADPPSPLPRQSYVVVIPDPGPARFVQVPTGTVLCERPAPATCPSTWTPASKSQAQARVITGDDLYDRRGGRWRIKLYPGR